MATWMAGDLRTPRKGVMDTPTSVLHAFGELGLQEVGHLFVLLSLPMGGKLVRENKGSARHLPYVLFHLSLQNEMIRQRLKQKDFKHNHFSFFVCICGCVSCM